VLTLKTTSQYRKDRNRAKNRGLDMSLLDTVIQTLIEEKPLAPKHKDHQLTGNFTEFRECHIKPDWLLMYTVNKQELILTASCTGTHSDLFG
jgi:mRNA interferase YafQ